MSEQTEPLALLGGTFDPVHFAHLRCAEEVREKLGLDSLYLLPAGSPPHRAAPQATRQQRLKMLQLALTEFPRLQIDPCELDRDGPSYMVNTLQEKRDENPDRPVILVIGQDAANQLSGWHHWQELFVLAHIVIMTRPGAVADYRQELAKQIQQRSCADAQSLFRSESGRVLSLQVAAIDICATTIKSLLRLGRSPQVMLPAPVLDYISAQGLYAEQ